MRIDVIEPGGFQHSGVTYHQGDVVTVPDDLGRYFCTAGWAKDQDGKVPTGDRDVGGKTLGVPAPTRGRISR